MLGVVPSKIQRMEELATLETHPCVSIGVPPCCVQDIYLGLYRCRNKAPRLSPQDFVWAHGTTLLCTVMYPLVIYCNSLWKIWFFHVRHCKTTDGRFSIPRLNHHIGCSLFLFQTGWGATGILCKHRSSALHYITLISTDDQGWSDSSW